MTRHPLAPDDAASAAKLAEDLALVFDFVDKIDEGILPYNEAPNMAEEALVTATEAVERARVTLAQMAPHLCANIACHNGVWTGGDHCAECR